MNFISYVPCFETAHRTEAGVYFCIYSISVRIRGKSAREKKRILKF